MIICALCGSVYQKSKIKCDTCKVNLHASQERNLPDVQVKLLVNPNSYDSVKLVLRKIGITAGISGYKNETNTNDRQWVFVMCDGLPYCLAHKLIHDAYYCLNCQDSV